MDLSFGVSQHGAWSVVALRGEVDVATVPSMRARFLELAGAGSAQLVVDLDSVDFLDSTGLGVLIGARKRARSAGGDLRLVCTNDRITKVLVATGLDAVFSVHHSIADAVAG